MNFFSRFSRNNRNNSNNISQRNDGFGTCNDQTKYQLYARYILGGKVMYAPIRKANKPGNPLWQKMTKQEALNSIENGIRANAIDRMFYINNQFVLDTSKINQSTCTKGSMFSSGRLIFDFMDKSLGVRVNPNLNMQSYPEDEGLIRGGRIRKSRKVIKTRKMKSLKKSRKTRRH
jgi:hypothetical protein